MTDEQTPDSPESDGLGSVASSGGAHRARRDGVGNLGEDQPGENLASPLLPEEQVAYQIAPDEDEAEELADQAGPADADAGDVVIDDTTQLDEAEQAARTAGSTRPVKRSLAADAKAALEADEVVGSRTRVTTRPRRQEASTEVAARTGAHPDTISKRVGPIEFIRQCISELGKVVWPTGSQLLQYFVVVLVFVLFIIAFVSAIDFLVGWLLLKLLG